MKNATVALEALAMLLLGAAIVAEATGGWRGEILGITISVRDAVRLVIFALVLLAVRVAIGRRRLDGPRQVSELCVRVTAGAALAGALIGWAAHYSPYVGGADSYGYVSAAERIRTNSLIRPEPIAALLPYADAINAATPLGYVPTARAANASVPAYPLGLPALMSLAWALGGQGAVFWVTPVMGLVLVALCCWFVYGRTRDAASALMSGALVALHPVVFAYAIQPMSDVPAAAFFLLAMALLLNERTAAVAGVAASMSFLIRPALFPGAAALALIPLSLRHRRATRTTSFLSCVFVGLIVQLASQWYLYGHPMANGYGPAANLFSLSFLPGNARSYTSSLFAVHGALWIGGVVIAVARTGTTRARWRVAAPLLVAAAPYAVYRTYDHWETMRFLLPMLVAATVAGAAAWFALCRQRLGPAGAWVALALLLAMAFNWVRWLEREHVFDRHLSEERFARAGELVVRATPANAVVIASLHSGSVRYYAQRATVDWGRIPPGQLDATVAAVVRAGRPAFVLIDGEEERAQFEARHGRVLNEQRWLPGGQVRDVRLYQSPH